MCLCVSTNRRFISGSDLSALYSFDRYFRHVWGLDHISIMFIVVLTALKTTRRLPRKCQKFQKSMAPPFKSQRILKVYICISLYLYNCLSLFVYLSVCIIVCISSVKQYISLQFISVFSFVCSVPCHQYISVYYLFLFFFLWCALSRAKESSRCIIV